MFVMWHYFDGVTTACTSLGSLSAYAMGSGEFPEGGSGDRLKRPVMMNSANCCHGEVPGQQGHFCPQNSTIDVP